MFSSLKTSFILVAALSVIASSAVPVKRLIGLNFDTKVLPLDLTKNECNLPGSPDIPVLQLPRLKSMKSPGAAENGLCGPTATVSIENGRSVDITNVGLCNGCAINEVQANQAVFKALGADFSKPLKGVKVVF